MKKFNLKKGVGFLNALISIIFFIIAFTLKDVCSLPEIFSNRLLPNILFFISIFIMIFIFVWSKNTLPHEKRANQLCTSGPYKFIRHPIYAAIVSNLNFGIALFLNNYIFLIWAIVVYIIWFILVDYEEQYLAKIFPNEYYAYKKRTGKFLPKFSYLFINKINK